MNASRQRVRLVSLTFLGLTLTACGHYKSDFGCKGYPEGSFCRPTTEIYNNRHQQLTKMKNGDDTNGDHAPSAGSSASDRVAAVAGQTEMQLGQPNIKPPQVMGVWIAPWRDGRNFLHEASLVYAIVEPADWTYGRKPKGMDKMGSGGSSVFAPFMSRKMVEAQAASNKNLGPNGGQPMMAPLPTAQPVQATPPIPSPAQDPTAILRQLQSQLPQQMPAATPIPSPYGGPPPGMDPELLQEQMQERMQNQRDKLYQ